MFFNSSLVIITPDNTRSLEIYCSTYFPHLPVTPAILAQLSWLQDNPIITSQSHTQINQDSINIEVKRAMTRYSCLHLLKEGSEAAWSAFVMNQPVSVKLDFEKFQQLASIIQSLSEEAQQCLLASCFITKSRRAENTAKQNWPTDKALSTDSEQFISDIVSHNPAILPICDMLNSEARVLLPFAFYRNAHARHMLDMEGGNNTVASIRAGIQSGEMDKGKFALWFARWILNIAGLDGHVNSRGSVYLTDPVAACMSVLKSELDKLYTDANNEVLFNYLQFRSEQLVVGNIYFAYLGALMRQYSPVTGLQIKDWFEGLPAETQLIRLESFKRQLQDTKVTPTYKPTVLVNLLALKCSVSESLTLFSHIESCAFKEYNLGIAEGTIPASTPLCFRTIAFEESLMPVITAFRANGNLPEIAINAKAEITHKVSPPEATEDPKNQLCTASCSY